VAVVEFSQGTVERAKRSISIKNILYATDFSAISEAALPYAGAIARRFGSTLHIAHVVSDAEVFVMPGMVDYVSLGELCDEAQCEAKEKIDAIVERLGDMPCRTHVGHGRVWTNLQETIAANQIDLIVLGTHGRTGFGKIVLGSVAEEILRHAPCPVLTAGPKIRGHARLPEFRGQGREMVPAELELQRILFATNLNSDSVAVAKVAVGLAKEFESRLTLMHVIEDYSKFEEQPRPIESAIGKLQALVPKEASLAYVPETLIEFGFASERIVRTAAEQEADLIVLGARPSDSTHTPWSTVHRVVAHANCPVLTVRE
jgi:nucleotide-binding universal stress UspA family protein